ncbi:Receptor-type tyrosine-protein phosphatase U [Liparis tanakae]|uniref:Receptor-type tyrosine-protein phosphatase U n=1 Tax=Liparis tanakae TaxID=230148 RepID=A0A4Z2IF73_9TELE|nr:Receptor-type tyrosine-protein phosphatase U [Liparis tanakae]
MYLLFAAETGARPPPLCTSSTDASGQTRSAMQISHSPPTNCLQCYSPDTQSPQTPDEAVEVEALSSVPVKAAGCTFEEDSDPSLCDFTQGEEDDFDWLLFRTYSSPYASPDLLRAVTSHLGLAPGAHCSPAAHECVCVIDSDPRFICVSERMRQSEETDTSTAGPLLRFFPAALLRFISWRPHAPGSLADTLADEHSHHVEAGGEEQPRARRHSLRLRLGRAFQSGSLANPLEASAADSTYVLEEGIYPVRCSQQLVHCTLPNVHHN